jgi:hypothetical protein
VRFSERHTIKSCVTQVATRRDRTTLCRHCLTAVLSERSEDKLVFLINVQPDELFARTIIRSAAERMGIDDESDQVP